MKKLLFVIVLAGAIFSLFAAPKLEVTSFETDAKDLKNTFGKNAVYDRNKDLCATIRVETDLTETISIVRPSESYGTPDRRITGITYFFISAREGIIKFVAPGFEPLVYSIPRAKLPLKKGATYVVKLTSQNQVLGSIPVVIQTTPNDADKIVNGQNLGGGEKFQLAKGKYTLRLEKENYSPKEVEIDVSAKNNLFKGYVLDEVVMQIVDITTNPPNALISVNGEQKGLTPLTNVRIPVGPHNIKLEMDGYLTKNEKIEVIENGTNKFEFSLTKNEGFLKLSLKPTFATVQIGTKTYTQVDKSSIALKPQDYNFIVSASGYLPKEVSATITLGKTTPKSVSLTKNVGFLELDIKPTYADVIITGTNYKNQTKIELPPGDYSVVASSKGFLPKTFPLNIQLQKTTKKRVELEFNVGVLVLDISPEDAKIEVDGKAYKTSKIKGLLDGVHKLKLSKKGYFDYEETFTIKRLKTKTIQASLVQKLGKLEFLVKPDEIKNISQNVMRDEDGILYKRWQGQRILTKIPEGKYKIKTEAADYIFKEEDFFINHGETTYLTTTLKSYKGSIEEKIGKHKKLKWLSFLGLTVAVGGGVYLGMESDRYYENYTTSLSATDAEDNRKSSISSKNLSYVSYGISIVPAYFWIKNWKKQKEYEGEL